MHTRLQLLSANKLQLSSAVCSIGAIANRVFAGPAAMEDVIKNVLIIVAMRAEADPIIKTLSLQADAESTCAQRMSAIQSVGD